MVAAAATSSSLPSSSSSPTTIPLLLSSSSNNNKSSVRRTKLKPTSSCNVFIVNSLTTFILLIFRILECIICIPTFLWLKLQKIERRRRRGVNYADRRQKRVQRTVVIIGGNFAGLAALWELKQWQFSNNNDDDDDVRIVLIDQRDYSEYTPGVLRLYCDPWYFFRLAQNLPDTNKDDNFRRIKGTVTSIVDADNDKNNDRTNNAEHIKMKKKVLTYTDHDSSGTNDDTRVKMIAYDYLIIATGATYAAPISPATTTIGERGSTIVDRNNEWHNAHTKLKGAKRVLILGGGAVGVELASEIVDHYSVEDDDINETTMNNKKHVTIVDGQPSLVPLFPQSVGKYAEDWLSRRGVEIRLSESLKSWNDRGCVLADGTVLHADVVYVCFGNRPNSELVGASSSTTTTPATSEEKKDDYDSFFSLTSRRNVVVKDTLQLVVNDDTDSEYSSSCSWFACGDVASPPTNDEKQAFQAEMQGKVAAKNVIKLLESESEVTNHHHELQPPPPLLRYPQDIAGSDRIPLVFVLSLGRYDGVLGFNNICIPGPFAAVVKCILEYTKVSHMRGRMLGKLIWKIGDAVTLFLSRTVFPPSSSLLSSPSSSSPTTATTVVASEMVISAPSSTTNASPLSISRLMTQQNPQRRQLEQQLKLS